MIPVAAQLSHTIPNVSYVAIFWQQMCCYSMILKNHIYKGITRRKVAQKKINGFPFNWSPSKS